MPFYHLRLTAPSPLPRGCPREPRTLGDHLKKARLLQGLVRREAAAALGVSGATIKSWEAGETAPRAALRERVVRFLGYDPGDWRASHGVLRGAE
ncbi:MAG: helix-turn-helix transcriptional regulator [Thermoanaerobaculia bacterium]